VNKLMLLLFTFCLKIISANTKWNHCSNFKDDDGDDGDDVALFLELWSSF